jgi:hypothetical protein
MPPKHVAGMPIQVVNDKGSFTNERSDPFASPALIWLWLLAEDAAPPFIPNVTADQKTP